MFLDLALKATVLLTLEFVLIAGLRRASAASRHAVWTTVFVALLVLPVARAVLPSLAVVSRWTTLTESAPPVPERAATLTANVSDADVTDDLLVGLGRAEALLASVWVLGGLGYLSWIVVGITGTRRIEASAAAMEHERVLTVAQQATVWLGVRRPVRWLTVSTDSMPVTWGVFRPRVLLPDAAGSWSTDRLEAVLTHELSHVLRRDAASHLIARLATALWWWHPLTWVAVRQARLERERACDDLVLARGVLPSGYAADLVLFVESLRAPAAGSSSALAMARRSQLEGRVMTILESNVNRRGVSQAGILTAMLMLVLVWPLAAVVPAVTESATDDPAAVETSSQEQMPVRVGSQIKAPIKIVHVNPIYPEAAKAAGEQGIVIIEATIGIDGSVVDSSIIRPISEALNRAAVAAVSQWKFSPILLNGQAVPAIMTVTVNFRLDADGNPVPQPLPPDPPTQVDQQDPLIWSPGDQPLRIGGEIKAPQKIKDVAPVYPQDAKEARVSGIVILEIQLDADGRVTDAKVIRPVAMLSDAAVDAVLQWEFTPTLHNGQPVPVIMTVTVNFTLQ